MSNLKRWFAIALLNALAGLLLVGVLATVPTLAQGPGGGTGGGMMGGFGNRMGQPGAVAPSAEMTVTPEQAVEVAQTYLDTSFSEAKLTVDTEADPFYGYYTLHVNKDGQTAGMLSVNGYSGQVFLHTWHGKLIEMSGE
jgi:hypothetical protein